MAVTTTVGVEELRSLVGQHGGYSDWHEVTQEQVNVFAEATGGHQWIHVDVERAQAGPFGGPIAHGYLTLSLTSTSMPQILDTQGFTMGLDHGCEKVRFPAPVPVGSQLRCGATVDAVTDVTGGVQRTLTLTFEVRDRPKPACVATILIRKYL